MASEFHREYLLRLPLPLAQLYSRAYNAKDARSRHDNTFYLFEALVKLAAATAVAAYLDEVRRGALRAEAVDRELASLALPSWGQWVGILRELARHFGKRPDAASHPLGHLWDQLNASRRDLSAVLALFQRIKNGPDGEPARDSTCSLMQLFEALVQYRNGVFGHGAGRFESFYEKEMGPLLLPAVNEVLAEGVFDALGPRGSRLLRLTEIRKVGEQRLEVCLSELVGKESERAAPIELSDQEAAGLAPNCVAVLWPGRSAPLRLAPMVVYRGTELAEEVLFLNRDRNGRQVEYLSYTTGRTERDRSMVEAMARLLSAVTRREIGESDLADLAARSAAGTPSAELLLGDVRAPGSRGGDYEILAELGRGGMGIVYLARQLSLGRLVALKMLPADLAGDEIALARFRREIRALARCEHPNIVKVLASGTMPDGRIYYTMEYVPGADLEHAWRELAGPNYSGEACKLGSSTWACAVLTASRKKREETVRHACGDSTVAEVPGGSAESASEGGQSRSTEAALPLPPLPELAAVQDDPGGYSRRVAMLIRDAASAVQAVHDQQIVHRDIKPANLMLAPDGSRVVLMDFGLAKGQSLALTKTQSGGFLGTLRYAAPEQLAAAALKVGPQADVRGLGVTLWELLTRRRLFAEAEDEKQLASLIHEQDVPRIRSVDPSLDADLEAIVARATERRVADRIQTAAELAHYLDLYVQGKPLPIRRRGLAEGAIRWARDHKSLVTNALIATCVIVAAVVVSRLGVVPAAHDPIEDNAEAYALYQQGLHMVDQRQEDLMALAIGHFQEAVKAVPTSALASTALADAYNLGADYGWLAADDAFPKAKAAAEAALKCNERSADAHLALACTLIEYDCDWPKAEKEHLRALELKPGLAAAHHWYAWYLVLQGWCDEAESQMKQAQRLAPADLIIACNAGKIQYYARKYQAAAATYKEALKLNPDFRKTHWDLGLAYVQLGKLDAALGEFSLAKSLTEDGRDLLAARGYAYASRGDGGRARAILAKLEPLARKKSIAYEIAAVYAALSLSDKDGAARDRDAAFSWLQRAFREHSAWRCYIKVDPRLDGLRADPRFPAFLKQAGFAGE